MKENANEVRTQGPSSRPAEHLRFHEPHLHLAAPFGSDAFGRKAEVFARAFGTPTFLLAQTGIVLVWIALNAIGVVYRWDPYPFILLNLGFSLQAAYAAPLILLAQTRQADRDKALAIADAEHREAVARDLEELMREIHDRVCAPPSRESSDLVRERSARSSDRPMSPRHE